MHRLLLIGFFVAIFGALAMNVSASPEEAANFECPQNYNPVCARANNGEAKTFSNACMAQGAIIISQGQCRPCPKNYRPVCGKLPRGERTYSNACEAKIAGITNTRIGTCQSLSKAVPSANCPKNYEPICGLTPSGKEKTYSNMCQLRAQKGDAIYKGKCRTAANTVCPKNYNPVCGQVGNRQITYGNDCERKKAGARYIKKGQCR